MLASSGIQQEQVNTTAEEEVEDDEEMPDLSVLRVEPAYPVMNQANGKAT